MKNRILALALGIAMLATNADARPRVMNTLPAADDIVASSPAMLRIEFSERLVAKFSGLELRDWRNKAVPLGSTTVPPDNPKVLIAQVPTELTPGDYTVVWDVVSADTHRVQGRYTFHIRP